MTTQWQCDFDGFQLVAFVCPPDEAVTYRWEPEPPPVSATAIWEAVDRWVFGFVLDRIRELRKEGVLNR